ATTTAVPDISTLSLHDALPILTTLLRAIGSLAKEQWFGERLDLSSDQGILDAFRDVDTDPNVRYIQATLDRDPVKREDEALLERSEEHTSELQSPYDLVCRLLL